MVSKWQAMESAKSFDKKSEVQQLPGDKQLTPNEKKNHSIVTPTDFSNETTSTSLYNNACWPFVTDQRSCPYKYFSATVMNLL